MSIAQTILEQLGGRRFVAMTGAKNFLDFGDELQFTIGGGAKKRISIVNIRLTDEDLYDVRFGKVFKGRYQIVKQVNGLYFDQLQPIFTEATGFYTHL